MKVVVLLSGGMDSVTALHAAMREHEVAGAVSFHYGAKHNDREIAFAIRHAAEADVPHVVMPLGFIDGTFKSDLLESGGEIPKGHYEESTMKKTVVPFRNGIMLSIAAGYAESVGAAALSSQRTPGITRSIRIAGRNSFGRWAMRSGSGLMPASKCCGHSSR